MKNKSINNELQKRIRGYVEYMHHEEKNGYYRADKILKNLSNNLREELSIDSYGKNLNNVPIFKDNFSRQFLNKLTSEIKEVVIAPGEFIVYSSILYFNLNNILKKKFEENNISFIMVLKGEIEAFFPAPKKKFFLNMVKVNIFSI